MFNLITRRGIDIMLKEIKRVWNNVAFNFFSEEKEDEKIGSFEFEFFPNCIRIINFMIEYKYQNQGYGTKMMKEAIAIYKEMYSSFYPELTLRVLNNNVPALKLYHKCGFQPFELEPPYRDNFVFKMKLV